MRKKMRLVLLSKPAWIMTSENRGNIEKRLDCCAESVWLRKKILSRVSGKRKKKYYLR